MNILKNKKIHILIIVTIIISIVYISYPIGYRFVSDLRGAHSSIYAISSIYPYEPTLTEEIIDTSKLSAAEAVPILMYHGVVSKKNTLGVNTDRDTFIKQMEMLKINGYKTITIKDYEMFRAGKLQLPAKPIIITFDDGRKDSFYTVEKILEKLNFNAVLFVATTKANNHDPFYLGWDELADVMKTGHWEIGAHGRLSHESIYIDEKGTLGKYYTSRMYVPGKGLESIDEYKKRVEDDYINGILDIKKHLNIDTRYFAIPLSNYGVLINSNFKDAYLFNEELTKKYFDLAFAEIESFESFYNYRDSDPYKLIRLEVKNLRAEDLLYQLNKFSPKPPTLVFPNTSNTETLADVSQLLYGNIEISNKIILSSNTSTPAARILFGDRSWKNYYIETTLVREKGRSASILAYYKDEDNYISLGLGEKSVSLVEYVHGVKKEIASFYPWEKTGEIKIMIRINNGYLTVYFDRILLAQSIPIELNRGAAGFSVWDPLYAQSTLRNIRIYDLNKINNL